MHNIVIEHRQSGYVSHDGVVFDGFVNLTDNATLNHPAPLAINAPIAGAGATTVLEGRLVLANQPVDEIFNMPNQTVWLSYTSSVDGAQKFTTQTDASGSWSITLNLSEAETEGTSQRRWASPAGRTHRCPAPRPPVPSQPDHHQHRAQRDRCPQPDRYIEGPLANNSILLLNDNVWVNGSAFSLGTTPTALAATCNWPFERTIPATIGWRSSISA